MAILNGTEITPMDLRARTGDILDHVRLRHDVFIISRRGQPMAALVPVERLKMMEDVTRKYAKLMLRLQEEHLDASGASLEEVEQEAVAAVERLRAKKPRR
jgi:prevent-host-death family protein